MTELVLQEPFKSLWPGETAFERAQAINGEVVRSKEGRTTKRCSIGGAVYYIKVHTGVGWGEITKNLLQLKAPVTGAENEWRAIQKLTALGVDTLDLVAHGAQQGSVSKYVSFIATREITDVLSLAEYAKNWPLQPPSFMHKRALIDKVASISRTLHSNGINHRDLYICHFLLKSPELAPRSTTPILHVVDLHRAQIRAKVPLRWRVKDVASLYFSSMDIGLTRRDVYRFLCQYSGLPLRQVLAEQAGFLLLVKKRAGQLYKREFKRPAPHII